MDDKYIQLASKINNLENQIGNMKYQIEELRRDRDNYRRKLEEFDVLSRRINSISLENTIANLVQQVYELEQKYSDKTTNDQVKEYIERYFDSNAINLYEKVS